MDEKDEKISFNWEETKKFLIKYQVVLLILIPIILSIWFRAYPYSLPVTDDWAKDSVYSSMKTNIRDSIQSQYPDLLEQNREILVEKEFQKMLKENHEDVQQKIKEMSQYIKDQMSDDRGHTYLCDIDAYVWYEQAKNIVKSGNMFQVGDTAVGSEDFQSQRNGRLGKEVSFSITPLIDAIIYKIISVFNSNFSIMDAAFFFPLLIVTLSVIPAFFIGKRIGGNIAGLFAGIIMAINVSLLARTAAGFADSDANQSLFPLLVMWAFVEMIFAKSIKKKAIFACLTGLALAIYSIAWVGWWYLFDFLLLTLVIQLAYSVYMHRKEITKKSVHPAIKTDLIVLAVFFVSSFIFCSAFMSLAYFHNLNIFGAGGSRFFSAFSGPAGFSTIKEVGTSSLWPNVFTTVAEFNNPHVKEIITSMGGTLMFLISIVGILFTIKKKDEHGKPDIKWIVLMTIWFVGTAYAFTKGSRFAILLTPAFAIAFGMGMSEIYGFSKKILTQKMNINMKIAKIAVIVILCFVLISPIKEAHHMAKYQIPGMNDVWYDSLIEIKNDSADAIITSWWDFGHWFVAISERKVTFDGGDQGRRIHWVGKTLLTSSEDEAVGILRMLNCQQDNAYLKLNEYVGDERKSVNLIYNIVVEDKAGAKEILKDNSLTDEQADEILSMTHCDNLLDQYFIASEDMVGKAGVWSHFGSWDFRKAEMYDAVKGTLQSNGTKILMDKFGKTENEAFQIYYEIQNTPGDQWIANWYSYTSDLTDCNMLPDLIQCGNGLLFNRTTNEAYFMTTQGKKNPKTVVYPVEDTKDGQTTQVLYEEKYNDNTVPISANLIKKEEGGFQSILMDEILADSLFTRLFFHRGRGLEHFELFSEKIQFNGEKILVYKVKF